MFFERAPNWRLTASATIKKHHEISLSVFEKLLEEGVCREQARGVLPQNMYTEYYGTANLSNIMKFIGLRTHEGAQWEIQQVANAMLEIIEELWPVAVSSYRENIARLLTDRSQVRALSAQHLFSLTFIIYCSTI
jgi:flavin-dependent thymidylate synthase